MNLRKFVDAQIETWCQSGLIGAETAERLRQEPLIIPPRQNHISGTAIFATFGVLIVALGVISLFAYNWEHMARLTKMGIILGSITLCYVVGAYIHFAKKPHWIEQAMYVLGTALFGAGIILVAQIYNINESLANGFLAFAVGALTASFCFRVQPLAYVATTAVALWGCVSFGMTMDMRLPLTDTALSIAMLSPILVFWVAADAAYYFRSSIMASWGAILFALTIGFYIASLTSTAGFTVFAFFVAITALFFYVLSETARRYDNRPLSQSFRSLGGIFMLPVLFVLSFQDLGDHLIESSLYTRLATVSDNFPIVTFLPPLLIILAIGFLLYRHINALTEQKEWHHMLRYILPPFIFTLMFIFATEGANLCVPANLLFVYVAGDRLWNGCRKQYPLNAALGAVLMGAWIFARFCVMIDSLLARGVVFILIGLFFVGVAQLYKKLTKEAQQ